MCAQGSPLSVLNALEAAQRIIDREFPHGQTAIGIRNAIELLRQPAESAQTERELAKIIANVIRSDEFWTVHDIARAVLVQSRTPAAPAEGAPAEKIAEAICCPSGCQYLGDSEDGTKCYCDTSDFHGSGIEKKTNAVLAALGSRTPAGLETENSNLRRFLIDALDALEAIDSEVVLTGHVKELADCALAARNADLRSQSVTDDEAKASMDEIAALRHDLDRYMAIAQEMTDEVERLRSRPQPESSAVDPVRHAFRAADDIDWAHLDQFLPQSGHGRFWRAVFAEIRSALSSAIQQAVISQDGEQA